MNSPQSQKEAVGSIVERYVTAAMTKTTAATIRFHRLNLFLSMYFFSLYFAKIRIILVIFALA